MSELFIGLMSGTSADAIDATLVDFSKSLPIVLATHNEPLDNTLRNSILSICEPGHDEINRLGALDHQMGLLFAEASLKLLENAKVSHQHIRAIGSHGQTIRHQPNLKYPFTLQIGDPNLIAAKTRITTVADFRRRDIAHGGQGAPLTPAFHEHCFRSPKKNRAILNIGGMTNLTLLPADSAQPIFGFDPGPGNVLLDAWINHHQRKPYDEYGAFAASGKIQAHLLEAMLADPYFSKTGPKSTGREYFNLTWLEKYIHEVETSGDPADIQATLTALTVQTVNQALKPYAIDEVFVCGGGIHNTFLQSQLQSTLAPCLIQSTATLGIEPDWLEAVAFAWFAKRTLDGQPSNVPKVTGARQKTVLGGIYPPSPSC